MNKLIITMFLTLTLLFIPKALAHGPIDLSLTSTTSAQPEVATPPATIKYDLAFPGILPDHPLYKLKVLRDRISAALISNPEKKIEFYLLQTDKGILATAMLVDKKNYELAKSSALKAENNYTLLTQHLGRLTKRPSDDFFTKLETASQKHQEVLSKIINDVPKEHKKTFEQVLDFSKRNLQTLKDFKEMNSFD